MNRAKAKGTRGRMWIYGRHACMSALQNHARVCHRLLVTPQFLKGHSDVILASKGRKIKLEEVDSKVIDSILGEKSSHQGVLLEVEPLFGKKSSNKLEIEDVICHTEHTSSVILILDRVTDINNVGSILRSAACFGVDAVALPIHYAPSENSAIVKISSGATDVVPVVCIGNLVNTIEYLRQEGYWCYGMDAAGKETLNTVKFHSKAVIILGSESSGLRRLTKEYCDYLVRIPISPASRSIDSLNVSNAAAIALHSIYVQHHSEIR